MPAFEKPTHEMVEFFKRRTEDHINRVIKYMSKLVDFDGLTAKELSERARAHDQDKYHDKEKLIPYIWVTEYHRQENENGEVDETTQQMYELAAESTGDHVSTNKHHPEAHDSPEDMTTLDLAEMVADWSDMAEELGEGSAQGWADENIGSQWNFSDEQVDTIYRMIDQMEQDKNCKDTKTASVRPADLVDAVSVFRGFLHDDADGEKLYRALMWSDRRKAGRQSPIQYVIDEIENQTRTKPPRNIPISKIHTHEDWGRRVTKSRKNNPIIVLEIPAGIIRGKKYVVLDGQHRIFTREEDGETKISAHVVQLSFTKARGGYKLDADQIDGETKQKQARVFSQPRVLNQLDHLRSVVRKHRKSRVSLDKVKKAIDQARAIGYDAHDIEAVLQEENMPRQMAHQARVQNKLKAVQKAAQKLKKMIGTPREDKALARLAKIIDYALDVGHGYTHFDIEAILDEEGLREYFTPQLTVAASDYRLDPEDITFLAERDRNTAVWDSRVLDHLNYTDAYEGEFDEIEYLAHAVCSDDSENAFKIAEALKLDMLPLEEGEDVWNELIQQMAYENYQTWARPTTLDAGQYELGVMAGEFGFIFYADEDDLFSLRQDYDIREGASNMSRRNANPRWQPGGCGDLREFIDKAVFLVDGEGTVRLDDEDVVEIAIIFEVSGYGPHMAAIFVDQNRYHASPDTALQGAYEILEQYKWDNYSDEYEDLVEDFGEQEVQDYGMFTENFDGCVWTLSPEEAAATIEGTKAAKFIDIYAPEEENTDEFGSRRRESTTAPELGPEYSIPVDAVDLDPEILLLFHSSMGDPIYALGSRLMSYGETLASEEELDAVVDVLNDYLADPPEGMDTPEELDEMAMVVMKAEDLLAQAGNEIR